MTIADIEYNGDMATVRFADGSTTECRRTARGGMTRVYAEWLVTKMPEFSSPEIATGLVEWLTEAPEDSNG